MKTRRNNSRNKKGGWGGWARTTDVGSAWNGGNGANHFALSKAGITANPVPVPEFWGPGMNQANRLVPDLKTNALSKSGGKRVKSKRSTHKKRSMSDHKKRSGRSNRGGGFVFGGIPQDMQIGWDNLKIGAQNVYRGFMGTNQLNSASPWVQPALNSKMGPTPPKFVDLSNLAKTATMKVAKII